MNRYLDRLKTIAPEKQAPRALPKLTEPGFVGFDSSEGEGISEPEPVAGPGGLRLDVADEAERAALVEHDGRIPRDYAEAFAAICQRCPPGVPTARWWQFINDGGAFLDAWGERAFALGWTPEDVFGLDPVAPMARYDRMGLVWLLKSQTVTALTGETARLSGGHSVRRGTFSRVV